MFMLVGSVVQQLHQIYIINSIMGPGRWIVGDFSYGDVLSNDSAQNLWGLGRKDFTHLYNNPFVRGHLSGDRRELQIA